MDIKELRKKRLDDLKVGDKVYVREDLKIGNYYDGSVYTNQMKCGVVTVRSIERYPFSILSSGEPTDYRYFTVEEVVGEFIYTGEMVDWAKTEKLNISLYEKIDNICDLKVGDKVYIKDDLKAFRQYGDDTFMPEMKTGLHEVKNEATEHAKKIKLVRDDELGFYYTSEMIDWEKTVALNKKTPRKDVSDIAPAYDGTTLYWDGIKVVRDDKHDEDLEKAVMILLLKKEGYCFGDIKNVIKKTKVKWVPKDGQKFFFITSTGDISSDVYYGAWSVHEEWYMLGNCFRTEEEAEKKLEQVKKLLSE